ncbi:cobalt-precorrin-7 (C(5))-methyltransferase [Haloparvum sp. PAK95]|uniref:cobalt-precorrin-7 (C(5))-methyltransferase n=1 Tax=Haloparvum sp. PAK95 TaxID=3418962 RepID=UPI003D2F327A
MSDAYDLDSGPDPADYAAKGPDPTAQLGADAEVAADPESVVHAVGIGPGNREYLVPRAERAIREADVVVGFETVVEFVDNLITGDALTCGYRDEAEALEAFGERVAAGENGTAVLMGDPNHSGYQFVGKVQQAVDAGVASAGDDAVDASVRVEPGISSLQVAASRARTPMEDTTFVTLHKSGSLDGDLAKLRDDVGERNLLVLPRPFDWMPGDVAADLLQHGGDPEATALVLERLTHDDESVTETTLGDLAEEAGGDGKGDTRFSDLSVLAVRN